MTTFAMTEEIDIPLPIRFNPFKHHRNYLLSFLEKASPELITSLLHPICNNYVDLYIGEMTPEAITHEVIDKLIANQVLEEADFNHWINLHNRFRQIKLEDQSQWVVRKSEQSDRYIHLHPARTGPLSVRLKGSVFKTICQLKANIKGTSRTISLTQVNLARMQIGLSPVKKLEQGKGILKHFESFFEASLR
jgi:hypothetical protein